MGLTRTLKRAAVVAGGLVRHADPTTRRVVFCYHSVHPNRPFHSTTPEMFDRHVQWLKDRCHLVSLPDLMSNRARRRDKPLVAITFDDGYEDNHSQALPILARHGATATFFITAGFVDRHPDVVARFQRLLRCHADDLVPLDWTQVRELRACGMTIGSHTFSHRNLARLDAAETDQELRVSKDLISDRLSCDVDLLAYPFGKPRVHFTSMTAARTAAAGYALAAAVTFRGVRATDSSFSIPRFFTDGDDLSKLAAKIDGAYDSIGWWQEHVPLPVLKAVSPEDFSR
jgi:peptidoglycan/xylan/chitin deacetylase (PgdA/CDA1 family)